MSDDCTTLASIIFTLVPNDKSAQNENIESIVWRKGGIHPIDVSTFFTRSRLSNLRFLELAGNFRISSWERLAPRTTLLTTLSLEISNSPPSRVPAPTTPQLFSIFSSNPNLRELRLSNEALPKDIDGSTLQMPLHHLKVLALLGHFRRLFGFLRLLILPGTLDEMSLTGSDPTVEDISQNLGPYVRDYFRRDTRFQDRLEITSCSTSRFVTISVAGQGSQTPTPVPWLTLSVVPSDPPPGMLEQMFINLIAPIPREHLVSIVAAVNVKLPELPFTMPNIERLHLIDMELTKGLLQPNPKGPQANTKLFPSLQSLCLEDVIADHITDWRHLAAYLAHQTSGGQTVSLEVIGDSPWMPPNVLKEMEGLVNGFIYRPNPGAIMR